MPQVPFLVTLTLFAAYRDSYFSFCTTRGGYAGVATFCKKDTAQAVAAEDGMCGTLPLVSHRSSMGDNARICFPLNDAFWQRYAASSATRTAPDHGYNGATHVHAWIALTCRAFSMSEPHMFRDDESIAR